MLREKSTPENSDTRRKQSSFTFLPFHFLQTPSKPWLKNKAWWLFRRMPN